MPGYPKLRAEVIRETRAHELMTCSCRLLVQATLGAGTRVPRKGTEMNFGDLFDSPWKVAIIAIVVLVLFGSKKMPDAARSLGRSMRILKAEVSNMHGDEESHEPAGHAQAPAQALASPQQLQIEQLQQQVRDLQQQQAAAVVNGASAAEAPQTQQPG
jgi:sec-independent protein translocase protein TatA